MKRQAWVKATNNLATSISFIHYPNSTSCTVLLTSFCFSIMIIPRVLPETFTLQFHTHALKISGSFLNMTQMLQRHLTDRMRTKETTISAPCCTIFPSTAIHFSSLLPVPTYLDLKPNIRELPTPPSSLPLNHDSNQIIHSSSLPEKIHYQKTIHNSKCDLIRLYV